MFIHCCVSKSIVSVFSFARRVAVWAFTPLALCECAATHTGGGCFLFVLMI